MLPGPVAWLPTALYALCIEEANRWHPLEAGGVVMGYRNDPLAVVITGIIGAGPIALHGSHHFEPDYDWQLREIALHYERFGRRETYLGDWHSHPDAGNGQLSMTDRRVLRRIINTPSARTDMPLMAILHGNTDGWKMTVWRAQTKPRRILWPKLIMDEVVLRLH